MKGEGEGDERGDKKVREEGDRRKEMEREGCEKERVERGKGERKERKNKSAL